MCASTYPAVAHSSTWAGVGADEMLTRLRATLVLNPTNTRGVTKPAARLAEATESTATRAKNLFREAYRTPHPRTFAEFSPAPSQDEALLSLAARLEVEAPDRGRRPPVD